jgi:hypothetical protein
MPQALLRRCDRNAVDQQMVAAFLEHCDANLAPTALQNPDLMAIDPGPVIFLGGFRYVPDTGK